MISVGARLRANVGRVGIVVPLATAGCGSLYLGSDIVWAADFETGDLSSWTDGVGPGGIYASDASPSDASLGVTAEQAHSGRYAAKLTSIAAFQNPTSVNGIGLYKEGLFPKKAYYSAWYYIPEGPQPYQTISGWSILQLNVPQDMFAPNDGDGGAADAATPSVADGGSVDPGLLLNLSLGSLPPDNRLTLYLVDARHSYLTSPLPADVPTVPVNRWFQLECFYDNSPGSDGELRVWLDGAQIYDVHRPMSSNAWVYFMPCSIADDVVPNDLTLYIDDVCVSWSRVTPEGILGVTQ